MQEILNSVEFWRVVVPALAAIGVWWFTERAKLKTEQLRRREDHYRELVKAARGFYVGTEDLSLKTAFLDQVNLLWLYAPDHVIERAYEFLESVEAKEHVSLDAEAALARLMISIRKDMLSRSHASVSLLSSAEFRHLNPARRP